MTPYPPLRYMYGHARSWAVDKGSTMARHARKRRAGSTTAIATRPQLVVIRGGAGGGRRRRSGGSRRATVVRYARRGARAAKHALPATGLALGGLLLGYVQGAGWLDNLPALGGDKTLAMGAAGYLATRMTSNKYVREMGAAAICVAGFSVGREHGAASHPGGGKPAVHGAGGGVGPFGGA